jgi:hypothetical protein
MFQCDRPIKKKLKKFASHHDDGLAEGYYRCQLLWVIRLVSKKKENSKQPVLNMGFSSENPITSTKKQKTAPSDTTENKERVGLVLPIPTKYVNQPTCSTGH